MNHVYKRADRVKCPTCDHFFSAIGIKRHRAACIGTPRKVPAGHKFCDCGRLKSAEARCCFRCEHKDLEVFADLDARIDSRRDAPIYQVGPRVARLMRIGD